MYTMKHETTTELYLRVARAQIAKCVPCSAIAEVTPKLTQCAHVRARLVCGRGALCNGMWIMAGCGRGKR